MWSLAWPWVLLALPLPLLVNRLLPESSSLRDAGLKVPGFDSFAMLADRSEAEQLLSWKLWVAAVAWLLLVVAAARPERIGDELDVPVSGRNLMAAVYRSCCLRRFRLSQSLNHPRCHCRPFRRGTFHRLIFHPLQFHRPPFHRLPFHRLPSHYLPSHCAVARHRSSVLVPEKR